MLSEPENSVTRQTARRRGVLTARVRPQENLPDVHAAALAAAQAAAARAASAAAAKDAELGARDAELAARGAALAQLARECAAAQQGAAEAAARAERAAAGAAAGGGRRGRGGRCARPAGAGGAPAPLLGRNACAPDDRCAPAVRCRAVGQRGHSRSAQRMRSAWPGAHRRWTSAMCEP